MTDGERTPDRQTRRARLARVLLGVIPTFAAVVIGIFAFAPIRNSNSPPPPAVVGAADQFIADLRGDPDVGPAFERLQLYYPTELRGLAEQATADGRLGGQEAMNRDVHAFMDHFLGSKRRAMTQAPAPILVRVADDSRVLMNMLRGDPTSCAQFAVQGTLPEASVASPAMLHQSWQILADEIEAAHQGETATVPRTRWSTQDHADLSARFAQIDAAIPPLFDDEAALDRAPADRQCSFGTAIWSAVLQLPQESAARYEAGVLEHVGHP